MALVKRRLVMAIIIALFLICVGIVSADIPQKAWKFRSDLNNSGVYDDVGNRPEGTLLWS